MERLRPDEDGPRNEEKNGSSPGGDQRDRQHSAGVDELVREPEYREIRGHCPDNRDGHGQKQETPIG